MGNGVRAPKEPLRSRKGGKVREKKGDHKYARQPCNGEKADPGQQKKNIWGKRISEKKKKRDQKKQAGPKQGGGKPERWGEVKRPPKDAKVSGEEGERSNGKRGAVRKWAREKREEKQFPKIKMPQGTQKGGKSWKKTCSIVYGEAGRRGERPREEKHNSQEGKCKGKLRK